MVIEGFLNGVAMMPTECSIQLTIHGYSFYIFQSAGQRVLCMLVAFRYNVGTWQHWQLSFCFCIRWLCCLLPRRKQTCQHGCVFFCIRWHAACFQDENETVRVSELCFVWKWIEIDCSQCSDKLAHTEKISRNFIKSNWNQIVFTIFRLIWIRTDVRLVPNQSENGNQFGKSIRIKFRN